MKNTFEKIFNKMNFKKKLKILIVDDNIHFCNALKFLIIDSFEDIIDTIKFSHSGDEFLEEIKNTWYDIVFMDINLPDKSGIEVAKEATAIYRNLYIVGLSFHSEMKYIIQMIEAGARNYITKDEINKEVLKKILEKEYYLI